MQNTIYFNTNFLSSDNYIKVVYQIHERGVFGAIYNPKTKKCQTSREITKLSQRDFNRLILGRKPNIYTILIFDDFKEELFNFSEEIKMQNCSIETIEGLRVCVNNLYRSFMKYIEMDKDFINDKLNYEQVKSDLLILREELQKNLSLIAEKSNVVQSGWKRINLNDKSIKAEFLQECLIKIVQNNNDPNGTVYQGYKYRIGYEDEKKYDNMFLEVWIDNTDKANNDDVAVKTRKSIVMAKIINAMGLSNLVAGNIYPIFDINNFNAVKYYTIIDNNVKYSISADRVKEVKVYVEPPTE